MSTPQNDLQKIIYDLEILSRKQIEISSELNKLKHAVNQFLIQQQSVPTTSTPKPPVEKDKVEHSSVLVEDQKEKAGKTSGEVAAATNSSNRNAEVRERIIVRSSQKPEKNLEKRSGRNISWEKFIGENLISRIGILITIIGVGIGVKYSIDHQLISPEIRILLSYLVGAILLGVGFRLHKKYVSFGSVLVSGSIAILYFTTFFAFSLYQMMPHALAFGAMLLLTGYTVLLSIRWNQQVIALIGLVGAYAVPFLLNTGSGNVVALFTFMTLVNAGILVIAFKKFWKWLYLSAFAISWMIFAGWLFFEDIGQHRNTAILFSSLFFVIFYGVALGHLWRKEAVLDTKAVYIIVLLNATLFYFSGFSSLQHSSGWWNDRGWFTAVNGLFHAGVYWILRNKKSDSLPLTTLPLALSITFLSLSIPVLMDGMTIPLLWAIEATVFYILGTRKGMKTFHYFYIPLLLLSFLAYLVQAKEGYVQSYDSLAFVKESFRPVWNPYFFGSILFVGCCGWIVWDVWKRNLEEKRSVNGKELPMEHSSQNHPSLWKFLLSYQFYFVVVLLFGMILLSGLLEISSYWNYQLVLTNNEIQKYGKDTPSLLYKCEEAWLLLKSSWKIIYLMIFCTATGVLARRIYPLNNRNEMVKKLIWVLFGLTSFAWLQFLLVGLYQFSELRELVLENFLGEGAKGSRTIVTGWLVSTRYVGILSAILLLLGSRAYLVPNYLFKEMTGLRTVMTHTIILWILSSELIHQLSWNGSAGVYKLSLSLLWGGYALGLVYLGLKKGNVVLRYAAMGLLAITLGKLFLYDIANMNTIAKTIVMIALGAILLLVSFIYNRKKEN